MKIVTEAEIAQSLRALRTSPPRVVVSGNVATPWSLVRLVDSTLEQWRAFVMNPQVPWPCREGLITESPFLGPGIRHGRDVEYLPMRLSLVPKLFTTDRPPDVVLVHTTEPRRGKVSLGIEVNILPAAIDEVRRRGGLVIAQMNSHMPYTAGDALIDVEAIDLAFEVSEPLISLDERPPDGAASVIGQRVAALAQNGATLQMGIGQLPDAALAQMHALKGLGVWSELISDGIVGLDRAGALDASRPVTASFLIGSGELYAWAHENPRLEMRRTETVNDPSRIALQPAMLSINTAIEIDLFAQANASYVHGTIYSGFGGQPDFVSGALHSLGGHAVIALRSWHDKSGHSNIVPILQHPVCSFQHSEVITEQGTASLHGLSQRAQAHQLIDVAAHPRARAELRHQALLLGLTPTNSAFA
jgi:acyl-CoA hydrolase